MNAESATDDSSQWDQVNAVLRFVCVLLVVLACAGIGVSASLYLERVA